MFGAIGEAVMKKALLALVVFSLFSGVAASEAQAGLLRGCNRCCCVRWMPRRYYCPPTVCEPAAAEPVRQKKDLVEVNVTFEDEPRSDRAPRARRSVHRYSLPDSSVSSSLGGIVSPSVLALSHCSRVNP
jgi:hypothetical protein